jgi:hypothetical protein
MPGRDAARRWTPLQCVPVDSQSRGQGPRLPGRGHPLWGRRVREVPRPDGLVADGVAPVDQRVADQVAEILRTGVDPRQRPDAVFIAWKTTDLPVLAGIGANSPVQPVPHVAFVAGIRIWNLETGKVAAVLELGNQVSRRSDRT